MRFEIPLFVMLLVSGCSSIIEGSSQEIMVNTNPSGASCVFERNGAPIGSISSTPNATVIKKTKYDIIIKCSMAGYQDATYYNKSGSAGATFGNIVLGGGIGWAIDSASGADNKYDSPVNITLVPVGAPPIPMQGQTPEASQSQSEGKSFPTKK